MDPENYADSTFTIASRLYELEKRKNELETEIKSYRERLSVADLGNTASQVFDFDETGSVSIREAPPQFVKEYLKSNFQNIPSEELSSWIENNILEKIEGFELNDDYIRQATDEVLKNLLAQGVIKKKINYKSKLQTIDGEQSDLQRRLMEMGKIENSPHKIIVRRQRPGRKSRRGRPSENENEDTS